MDLLKSPRQIMLEEVSTLPHFSKGRKVTPKDMQAEMLVNELRQKFAKGGAVHPALAKAFNEIFK
jgi:hypothetical protein